MFTMARPRAASRTPPALIVILAFSSRCARRPRVGSPRAACRSSRCTLRLGSARLAVERRVDDPHRVPPLLRRPALEREAAVRAVVAHALLVPRPVVALAGDAELVRRLGPRRRSLDRVAALLTAPGAARVERDDDLLVVFLDVDVASAARARRGAPAWPRRRGRRCERRSPRRGAGARRTGRSARAGRGRARGESTLRASLPRTAARRR